jgi:hypothetical protein
VYADFVGTADKDDYYRINLATQRTLRVLVDGLSANASLQLIRDVNRNGLVDGGDVLAASTRTGTSTEAITRSLAAGVYFVRVYQAAGDTNYNLRLTAS